METPVTLSETAISVYMMVLPGLQTQSMHIALKTDGTWKVIDKEALFVEEAFTRGPADRGFLRGQKYVVSLDSESAGWSRTLTDSRDSNVYDLVVIGGQIWMAENLAYLPSVVGPGTSSNSVPYYYVYGYNGTDIATAKNTDNYNTYGVLYNWPAAMNGAASSATNPSGVQGICPAGWHLPSDAEWTQLENYLIANGYNYNGTTVGNMIAKSMATDSGWTVSSTTGAVGNTDYPDYRNKSGFSALPGGCLGNFSAFTSIDNAGFWWGSTVSSGDYSRRCGLEYNSISLGKSENLKKYGFSIRCIRN
ncbi:MAG: fibrobacter succinogenes major paralogous domain-containing protein [Bacteroidales bacterium]|nr:fibrobacter succinogenes major paralogous domain-containing protein [Bacteroidales bacterium]MDD4481502.1 fibrobacter succinogenes major paralogous domain-containing protein [Bacteroidales bacterium]